VILLGSEPAEEIWDTVKRREYDRYLIKPISLSGLINNISQAVELFERRKNTKPDAIKETVNQVSVEQKRREKAPGIESEEQRISNGEDQQGGRSAKILNTTSFVAKINSIEGMVADLERRFHKVKMAIANINQLQEVIDEAEIVIQSQQQDLDLLEIKLQRIYGQLHVVLKNFDAQ